MVFLQLPGDLQYKERDNIDPMDDLLEVEDLYATVLYNDEVIIYLLFGLINARIDQCEV